MVAGLSPGECHGQPLSNAGPQTGPMRTLAFLLFHAAAWAGLSGLSPLTLLLGLGLASLPLALLLSGVGRSRPAGWPLVAAKDEVE